MTTNMAEEQRLQLLLDDRERTIIKLRKVLAERTRRLSASWDELSSGQRVKVNGRLSTLEDIAPLDEELI